MLTVCHEDRSRILAPGRAIPLNADAKDASKVEATAMLATERTKDRRYMEVLG